MLAIPFVLALTLFLFSFLPRMQENAVVVMSFRAAAGVLLIWQILFVLRLLRDGSGATQGVRFTLSKPRPQHYIQALVHISIYAYWGWYWEPVYHYFWLLVGQLVFAYAFDMLLSWSRGKSYLLGFGPFPIIFSTNLFLWFRDDWFYLQFLMIAIGFLGKEYVRWNRAGKSTHIFNPSAFTLGLFSVVLIATNTTDVTWGPEIASTLSLAPGIYTYLFFAGLVVMYFFSITLVAASAAITLFGFSALYAAFSGVPYFLDSEIPTAVFLGLHLLVTDPSTSPRTPPGKVIFGILYGVGVFVLYSLLETFGAPTFYDKLLCVPLLNLSVQAIDRFAKSIHYTPVLSKLGLDAAGGRANLAHMAVWISFFAVMSLAGKTDSRHVGDSLPFWEQACAENRATACDRLLLLKATYCTDRSGWACNEMGAHYAQARLVEQDMETAMGFFARACELRYQAGCLNLLDPSTISVSNPRDLDLRLLLREGGRNLLDMPEEELLARACEHQWAFACERI